MRSVGEIFDGIDVAQSENDGEALAAALSISGDVPAVVQQLRGPWALLWWQTSTRTLWFGRDVLGASAAPQTDVQMMDRLHSYTFQASATLESLSPSGRTRGQHKTGICIAIDDSSKQRWKLKYIAA